jgi:phosphoglycerate kinase
MILDIGPKTGAALAATPEERRHHRLERPGRRVRNRRLRQGHARLGQAIAESKAFSIAGGGETLAAIAKFGLEKRISYISTGGGAFPGIPRGQDSSRRRRARSARLKISSAIVGREARSRTRSTSISAG